MRAYLKRRGKPVAFYSDRFSVFRVNARALSGPIEFQNKAVLSRIPS